MPGSARFEIPDVARVRAAELVACGAQAVMLMGSFARGAPAEHSDIDLLAVGDGPEYRLERAGGYLLAVSWQSRADVERSFGEPGSAGYVVQGWRDAVVLEDRQGIATAIQQQANAWSWSEIDPRDCDRYVADQICGLAEEVHKLANLLASGQLTAAAVQRNVLANRLAQYLAVHLRLLYATENDLWDLVSARMGKGWEQVQVSALGLPVDSFEASCLAALELYALAADEVHDLFGERELAVVEHACGLRATLGSGAGG